MFGSLLLIILLVLHDLGTFGGLLLVALLALGLTESADSVGRTRQLVDTVGDLASANQRDDNTGTDDECQDEAVYSIPRRGPAPLASAAVRVVEEVESDELGDQGVFNREKDCGPCDCGGPDADCIALVTLISAVASKLQTPVDSAKE